MRKVFDNLDTPSDFYLSQLERDTESRASASGTSARQGVPGGAPAGVRRGLEQITESLREDLVTYLHSLHANPEVAFEEVHAARSTAELLSRYGLEAQVGAYGLTTAVHAEFASADYDPATDRTIAILSEYDALVGLGHACGHNVIAATGVGAAISLFILMQRSPEGFRGRVVFLGTPAEEGRTGKEYMAREGAFDDVDAAIMVHPYGYDLADQVWLGRRVLTAEFEGISAHASAQPFQGRNALDAASLAYQGLGVLRQQILPVDRLHAVISSGGDRASIIADSSRLDLYVRSKYPETLRDLSKRVENVLEGASLMTGTRLTLTWDQDPPSLPVRTNTALTARWVAAQQHRGRAPLPPGVVPETIAASTDFGNISYRVPGIHPLLKISASDVALHTAEFCDAAKSEAAEHGAVDGAYGLAATAIDFLTDDNLARTVRQEFEAAGGAADVAHFFDGD